MPIPSFRYLRWYKQRAPRARISLAASGLSVPPESVLPLHELRWRLDIDDMNGYRPLEERVAHHLGVGPDRVVVVPGCTYASHAATRVLLSPGSTVMVESPTYELLVRLPELCGAQILRLQRPPENGFRVPREGALEEAFRRGFDVLSLTIPHNPSGQLVDELQVAELAALAETHDARILVDEVYLDFFPRGLRPYRSLAAVSDRFVTTGSLTKAQGLGALRVGWVAGPVEVVEQVRRYQEYLADRIPAFDAQAAVMAFERMDALLERAYEVRGRNWPVVQRWAAQEPEIQLVDPGAGITTVARIPEGIDALALAEKLYEDEGILVAPAEMFGSHGFLRISYGLPVPELEEGLDAVRRAVERAAERV